MATKKAAPVKKTRPAKVPAPVVVSPFRAWADRPDGAAMNELCEFLVSNSTGGHLAGFARSKEFPYVTVLAWINSDKTPGGRAEMYTRAREDRADILADEIVTISDEQETIVKGGEDGETPVVVVFDPTAVSRNKLRVDARKWAASKLKPRVYGDRTTLAGDPDAPLALTLDLIASDPRSRLTIK